MSTDLFKHQRVTPEGVEAFAGLSPKELCDLAFNHTDRLASFLYTLMQSGGIAKELGTRAMEEHNLAWRLAVDSTIGVVIATIALVKPGIRRVGILDNPPLLARLGSGGHTEAFQDLIRGVPAGRFKTVDAIKQSLAKQDLQSLRHAQEIKGALHFLTT